MKYARDCELPVVSILLAIISHVALFVGVSAVSRLPNPVLGSSSFSIATWSWPS
jgi:hypothetical protein